MPDLIEPDVARHAAWLDSHREWGPGLHEDGFGIRSTDDVESPAGFAAWVDGIRSGPERFWWIVEQDIVLGGIALRPFTNDQVLRLGHVGYGVRPSARGRGVATWALGQALHRARQAGLGRVLLVCVDHNAASIKTIERRGGVLDRTIQDGDALFRRSGAGSGNCGGGYPGMSSRAAIRRCTLDAANHPMTAVTAVATTIAQRPSIAARSINWVDARNTAPPIVT